MTPMLAKALQKSIRESGEASARSMVHEVYDRYMHDTSLSIEERLRLKKFLTTERLSWAGVKHWPQMFRSET